MRLKCLLLQLIWAFYAVLPAKSIPVNAINNTDQVAARDHQITISYEPIKIVSSSTPDKGKPNSDQNNDEDFISQIILTASNGGIYYNNSQSSPDNYTQINLGIDNGTINPINETVPFPSTPIINQGNESDSNNIQGETMQVVEGDKENEDYATYDYQEINDGKEDKQDDKNKDKDKFEDKDEDIKGKPDKEIIDTNKEQIEGKEPDTGEIGETEVNISDETDKEEQDSGNVVEGQQNNATEVDGIEETTNKKDGEKDKEKDKEKENDDKDSGKDDKKDTDKNNESDKNTDKAPIQWFLPKSDLLPYMKKIH